MPFCVTGRLESVAFGACVLVVSVAPNGYTLSADWAATTQAARGYTGRTAGAMLALRWKVL